MIRGLYLTVLAVVLLVPAAVAQEQPERPRTYGEADKVNTKVVIRNPGSATPGSSTAPVRGGRRGPRQPQPEHVITTVRLRPAPDGGQCVARVRTRRDIPMTGAETVENTLYSSAAKQFQIPQCGRSGVPARVAEPFVRTVPLPLPRPHIAPDGQAITGLPAFLETNGTLVHEVGPGDTLLGPITVIATGVYWVDWGDGSPEAGPFAFEGESYKTGRIFHTYRDTGDYTVTVRQTWSADWSLGGDSGTVSGLETTTSIPLDVDQIQAVIR